MKIFPSIICGDLLNLEKEILRLDTVCSGYHIDVMDDHFVQNLTLGPDFVNAIAQKTKLPCQVHLMVDNPGRWPERLELKNGDTVIFHAEVFTDYKKMFGLVEKIRNKNINAGIALNPETEIFEDGLLLSKVNTILLMSVCPGFSGQKFIPETMEKVKNLVNIKKRLCPGLNITIDGGIDKSNIKALSILGVDEFCVGSAIFSSSDPKQAIQELRRAE